MEEPVRDRRVLTKSQRSAGLHRCRVLLKPDLATVGDLAAHLSLRTASDADIVLSLPSRSARRKKAKRQWLRELRKTQLEEHKESQIPANDIRRKSPEGERINQNNGTVTEDDTEVVPVVILPGHIRFEPVDAEQSKEQPNGQVAPFQWNGTTSKKKGQKWGQEKTSRKSDDNAMDEDTTEKVKSVAGDGILVDAPIDFKCFLPLSRAPKEGDVIAYHLVVLSSAWCPKLSSVRVGKVSSYDSISMRIVLSPVRGHPIFPGNENAECVSVYKEDGSLEIDFSSLVDVRLFKSLSSDETAEHTIQKETTEGTAPAPVSNLKLSEKVTPVNNWNSTSPEDNLNVTVNNLAVATAPASNMKVALSQETVAGKVSPVDTWEAAAPVNVPEPVNYCEVAAPVNVLEKASSTDIWGEMNIANTSSTDKLESPAVNWGAPSSILDKKSDNWGASSSNANKKPAPFNERSWGEQINEALIEKKAELEKNGGWGEVNGGWGEKRAELQKNGGWGEEKGVWGERRAEPQKNRYWGKDEVQKSGGWKNGQRT